MNDNGLTCSMSAKGGGYDNACAESFFHSLKVDAIHGGTVQHAGEDEIDGIRLY